MSDVNAAQVGGNHYKGTTYQHWDFVNRVLHNRYLEGNITKYLVRWKSKGGLQDLMKAHHYLQKLIQEFSIGNIGPIYTEPKGRDYLNGGTHSARHFCQVNRVEAVEQMIIETLSHWRGRGDLNDCSLALQRLISEEENLLPRTGALGGEEEGAKGDGYVNQG